MKTLPPVKESQKDYEALYQELLDLFRDEIYLPLIEILGVKKSTLENSLDDLLSAIRRGQVYYSDGHFRGKYSSTLTRELRGLGAKWDRKHGTWKIPFTKLPPAVKTQINTAKSKFQTQIDKIDEMLRKIDPEAMSEKVSFGKVFDKTIFNLNKRFDDSVSAVTVAPKLSAEDKEKMRKEYQQNLRLAIKDFTRKETQKLREEIVSAALKGQRYETLVKKIQSSYGVTENKARFLARQETNLATAKLRETRYLDAGIKKYMWRCVVGSKNHPVRPMHKIHDGKIFSWDDPPVVNDQGDRKHPSEDFNCRCIAIPVIESGKYE